MKPRSRGLLFADLVSSMGKLPRCVVSTNQFSGRCMTVADCPSDIDGGVAISAKRHSATIDADTASHAKGMKRLIPFARRTSNATAANGFETALSERLLAPPRSENLVFPSEIQAERAILMVMSQRPRSWSASPVRLFAVIGCDIVPPLGDGVPPLTTAITSRLMTPTVT
jgi:hypothetical protein